MLRWVAGWARRFLWVLQEVVGRGLQARVPQALHQEVDRGNAALMQLVRVHDALPAPKPMSMHTSIEVRWSAGRCGLVG